MTTNDFFTVSNSININIITSAVAPDITGIQLTFVDSGYHPRFKIDMTAPDLHQKLQEAYSNKIVQLEKDGNGFKGTILNAQYGMGGKYDVGITVNKNGTVIGYGVGDTSYKLDEIIEISPPEALIQFQNGQITLGLAYTAIALTIFSIGFSKLLELWYKLYM